MMTVMREAAAECLACRCADLWDLGSSPAGDWPFLSCLHVAEEDPRAFAIFVLINECNIQHEGVA